MKRLIQQAAVAVSVLALGACGGTIQTGPGGADPTPTDTDPKPAPTQPPDEPINLSGTWAGQLKTAQTVVVDDGDPSVVDIMALYRMELTHSETDDSLQPSIEVCTLVLDSETVEWPDSALVATKVRLQTATIDAPDVGASFSAETWITAGWTPLNGVTTDALPVDIEDDRVIGGDNYAGNETNDDEEPGITLYAYNGEDQYELYGTGRIQLTLTGTIDASNLLTGSSETVLEVGLLDDNIPLGQGPDTLEATQDGAGTNTFKAVGLSDSDSCAEIVASQDDLF